MLRSLTESVRAGDGRKSAAGARTQGGDRNQWGLGLATTTTDLQLHLQAAALTVQAGAARVRRGKLCSAIAAYLMLFF